MNTLVKQQIRQYRIDRLLGEGGMASVYRAFDQDLKRHVALKVVHQHLARQPRFRQRFLQEAQVVARLDHPAIAKIYHFGTEEEILYLAMEYVAGGTLGDYLARLAQSDGTGKLRQALLIVAQVADALNYAHRQGIIHRDVKPDNVLLKPLADPDHEDELPMRAIVTDFGLATLLDAGEQTAHEEFMGSLPYMSPEQCLAQQLDGRCDLYALGVILYRLATGRLPFTIKRPPDVMKHVNETPPSPRDLRPDLPPAVEAIILKALAKKPQDRFHTAEVMALALRQAATALRPMTAAPPRVSSRLADTPVPPPHSNLHAATDTPSRHEGTTGVLTQLEAIEWNGGLPRQMEGAQRGSGEEDYLVIGRKGETPNTYALHKDTITIGRDAGNDIVLAAVSVSRHHARLEQTTGGCQVIDLGSANGTLLEGNRLLPDVAETWESHQTLRIGPFFLQWKAGKQRARRQALLDSSPVVAQETAAGDGATIHSQEQLSVRVEPGEVEVAPGNEVTLQVALFNQGETVDHFQIQVEALPASWVTVPEEPLQLLPGERGTLPVTVHPPLDSSARAGEHRYRLVIDSTLRDQNVMAVDGRLSVAPFERFKVDMQPKSLQNKGVCRVLISNESNFDATYSVIGRDDGEAIRFLDPHQAQAQAAQDRRRRRSLLKKLPLPSEARRAEAEVTRWETALGHTAAPPPQAARLGTFHTRIKVAAGEQGTVSLALAPKERPFLARGHQTHPFQIQVSTATADPQTLAGQLEVTPVIPPWLPPLLLLLLFAGAVLFALLSDSDQDGLANGSELAIGSNPNDFDTDKDGVSDGDEVAADLDPVNEDSDGDGVPDGEEAGVDAGGGAGAVPITPSPALDTPGAPITPTATLTPTVTPSPTPTASVSPVAAADTFTTAEDTPLNSAPASVLDNDSGAEGVALTAVLQEGPQHGVLSLNPNGTFVYTPAADFSGSDSFTYLATGNSIRSGAVTVLVNVTAVDDAPAGQVDRYSTSENSPLESAPESVLDNDTDVDSDTLTAVLESGPRNGTVTLNGNGTFIYTPATNFFGSDTFTYRASDGSNLSAVTTAIITVGAVDEAPVANNDSFSVDEDGTLESAPESVLDNDSDTDSETLTAVLVNEPVHGTVSLQSNGTFTYQPTADFDGSDSFTYQATDGVQNSNAATVVIDINAVNDPPVAEVDRYRTDEDTPLVSGGESVLDNDTDVDSSGLTAVLDNEPENGTVDFAADGTFVYTPNPHFFGTDTFTYHAGDGNGNSNTAPVIITIRNINDVPQAMPEAFGMDEDGILHSAPYSVLNNDDDFDGEALTAVLQDDVAHGELMLHADGTFTYQPDDNFSGTDNFTYRAHDGTAASDPATVTLTINAINDPPVVDLNGAEEGLDYNLTFNSIPTPPIQIAASDMSVTDVDSSELVSATVRFVGSTTSSEELTVNTEGTNITSLYDNTAGVLHLSGSDSIASYQQVLRTAQYNFVSTPGDRVIEFMVYDGIVESEPANATIEFLAPDGTSIPFVLPTVTPFP